VRQGDDRCGTLRGFWLAERESARTYSWTAVQEKDSDDSLWQEHLDYAAPEREFAKAAKNPPGSLWYQPALIAERLSDQQSDLTIATRRFNLRTTP